MIVASGNQFNQTPNSKFQHFKNHKDFLYKKGDPPEKAMHRLFASLPRRFCSLLLESVEFQVDFSRKTVAGNVSGNIKAQYYGDFETIGTF